MNILLWYVIFYLTLKLENDSQLQLHALDILWLLNIVMYDIRHLYYNGPVGKKYVTPAPLSQDFSRKIATG